MGASTVGILAGSLILLAAVGCDGNDADIAALRGEATAKDATIEEINADLTTLKDQTAAKDATIDEINVELTVLKDQTAAKDATIEEINAELTVLKDQITARDATIQDLNRQLQSLSDQQPTPAAISRLEAVRERGRLLCGGRNNAPRFGFLDADGRNVGFEIDLCRAVAAAVFGDPQKLEVVPISSAADRGPYIQSGAVDVMSRGVTWTTSRDVYWGDYTITMFYDGQGFMVRKDSGLESALDLDGATVCVTSGTTTELGLHRFSRMHDLRLEVLTFVDLLTPFTAYEQGSCDAITTDRSLLAINSVGSLSNPEGHVILPETISKEPTAPMVPSGDNQWLDIVRLVMSVLINAEELGVTQSNVDDLRYSDNVATRLMLGTEGDFGQARLGLSHTFAVDVIRAVGNYDEIYDRHMGPHGDAVPLERGLNRLWTEGGLLFAPPIR